MHSVLVPFSGFYYSVHDDNMDRALEQALQDSNGDSFGGAFDNAWEHVKWKEAQTAYAKMYTEWLFDALNIAGAEFEEMVSPREYNFTTDRIFVKLPLVSLLKIHAEVDLEILDEVAAEMFTSRSGFISHYSPDITTWPAEISEWDHNQLGCLLDAYVRTQDVNLESLMDDANCNSDLDNILFANCTEELHRLGKLSSYLRERQERRYRVPA